MAVKVIRADLATDPEFLARLRREVTVARRVSSRFTATVVGADTDGPVPWLATTYVAGPSLADAVAGHGPLPAWSVRKLAAGLAEGLSAIHAAGVVHRDLKPSNVLLTQDGPRVIDFGISQAARGAKAGALIERCLAKHPGERPTACDVLAEAGAVKPTADWLPAPVTRTFVQLPALADPAPTVTSARLPASGEPITGQPERHEHRRRRGQLGRPLAIASLVAGLLAASAAGGIALTAAAHQSADMHSGQVASGQITSAAPRASQTSAVGPSMPSAIMSSTAAPSATMSPTASPTPTPPSASMSPTAGGSSAPAAS